MQRKVFLLKYPVGNSLLARSAKGQLLFPAVCCKKSTSESCMSQNTTKRSFELLDRQRKNSAKQSLRKTYCRRKIDPL